MFRSLRTFIPSVAVLSLIAACGSAPPPAAPPPPPPPPAAPPPAETAAVTPPPPAEPTPEEKKKAEEAKKLEADKAKLAQDTKDEQARWTPELHAAAKALAEKDYASGHAAIQAAMASKTRKPGDAARDKARHPLETLDFFGFKPTMTVLDVGPGEGWYEELLAPALAKKGKLLATTADPNGPPDSRATLNGQRFKAFLDSSPELYGKVQPVVVDGKAPALGLDGTVDLVLVMRGLH